VGSFVQVALVENHEPVEVLSEDDDGGGEITGLRELCSHRDEGQTILRASEDDIIVHEVDADGKNIGLIAGTLGRGDAALQIATLNHKSMRRGIAGASESQWIKVQILTGDSAGKVGVVNSQYLDLFSKDSCAAAK
jgi:hypothetical protein